MTKFIEATPKLARMLADENITVVHGKFRTASFNTVTRTLCLPLFTEKLDDKDVYTLFVAHEVGHALYTPDVWHHDANDAIPGIPHEIINIVEDIRIEKLIRRNYSGLYRTFIAGYKSLIDDNFFGINGMDISTLGFLNRLNLYAKAGAILNVPFSENEKKMVDLAMAIETWDDTLRICKLLRDFAEEQDRKQEEQSQEDQDQQSGEEDGDEDQQDQSEGQQDQSEGQQDQDQSEGQQSGEEDQQEEEESEDTGAGHEAAPKSMQKNTDTSTDTEYRAREQELVESDEVRVIRLRRADAINKITNKEHDSDYLYDNFMKSNRAFIQSMVNQFNARFAAKKQQRIVESQSGVIDPLLISQYKFNENIFKTYGIDPNQKNHAVCMFVDLSGSMSMSNRIHYVAKQVGIMASFCRQVNIPFVVYGWGDNGYSNHCNSYYNDIDCRLFKLIDSTMGKTEFRKAISYLQAVVKGYDSPTYGGTPLTEAKAASIIISNDYKNRHNADKLHVIMLTDGMGRRNFTSSVAGSDNIAKQFHIEVEGMAPRRVTLDYSSSDERALDEVIKEIATSYIHIDVAAGGSNITHVEAPETNTSYYDRSIKVGSAFRAWAVKASDDLASSSHYPKMKKMSGMIGKFVA